MDDKRFDNLDLTLPDDASGRARFPHVIERSPSNLVREARAAFDAGLFIACLTILVTVPDVCANLKQAKTGKPYGERDWCAEYLGLLLGPVCKSIDHSNERTHAKLESTLKQLERSDNFTASDFSQLRNAVLHAGSAIITGHGAKYSPFNSIGVQVTNNPDQLVIGYGSTSTPTPRELQTNFTGCDDEVETDCHVKLLINLTALLAKVEEGARRFIADNPDLDKELGKWEVANWGIVDLRTHRE
jgi:hypothetical protein